MNLIVFDIDDTLTKSEYQHQLAYVNSMKEFGIENINQNWKEYKHHTDSYILKINYENNLDKKFDLNLVPKFESKMAEIMQTLKSVEEIEGARNFVKYLKKDKNYALTFATGSFRKPALLKLKQADIWHDEKLVATSNEYYEREQIVIDAIEKAKEFYRISNFENIISVGDGIWDMKTARNLNVKFIGVGMKNLDDFKKENIEVHTENWKNFDFKTAENKLLTD
ncbi:MAG: HAD family hydrolase [Paracoccus sp. (in: a-proteobacteria)]